MREPQVDMLAKIAVVLDIPLEAMVGIQKREQILSVITKLSVSDVKAVDDEIRAVSRTGDNSNLIDAEALAETKKAFRMVGDDS